MHAQPRPLHFFAGAEHESFDWPGHNRGAALLVHGFPGTPSEMRTVATWLHGDGWSVRGLLLPGFGTDFPHLHQKRQEEWLAAVYSSLHELARSHAPLLLVGNSVGAALSFQAAARMPAGSVHGLIALAPFWRLHPPALDAALQPLTRAVPHLRPFRLADFANPFVREAIRRLLPEADLGDAATQQAIRTLQIHTRMLVEVQRAGRLGHLALPQIDAPVLIIQGARDRIAHPALARVQALRLPRLAGFVLIDADHQLAHMQHAHERTVRPLLLTFAQSVRNKRL